MTLRDDFEALQGSILHCNPLPSVDSMVNELKVEEIRLKTHISKGLLLTPTQTILAVPPNTSTDFQGKQRSRVAMDESSFCK